MNGSWAMGNLIGEFMSKKEVRFLKLKNKIIGQVNQEPPVDFDISGSIANMDLNNDSSSESIVVDGLNPVKSANDLLFDTQSF